MISTSALELQLDTICSYFKFEKLEKSSKTTLTKSIYAS